jgi:hypothetical protein
MRQACKHMFNHRSSSMHAVACEWYLTCLDQMISVGERCRSARIAYLCFRNIFWITAPTTSVSHMFMALVGQYFVLRYSLDGETVPYGLGMWMSRWHIHSFGRSHFAQPYTSLMHAIMHFQVLKTPSVVARLHYVVQIDIGPAHP